MSSPRDLEGTPLSIQGWTGGMNSSLYPAFLRPSQYRRAVNVSNRGGVISPRPGFVQVDALPDGLFQGAFLFHELLPAGGVNTSWAVAISGMIYLRPVSDTPGTWTRVVGVQLAATATTVRFARMERFADSSGDTIVLLPSPESVLIAVDGVSLPVAVKGGIGSTLPEVAKAASRVATAGNRVWFSIGNRVIASDFGDPISFEEHLEAGPTEGSFYFDSEVTALYTAPARNQQDAPLLVFTALDSEALRADVSDREQWASVGFRTAFASGVGCLDPDSIVKHEGTLWWVSASGLVSADRAVTSYVSSRLARRDVELRDWDPLLAPSNTAKAVSHDGRLIVSRPLLSGEVASGVLDGAVVGDISGETPPVWASFWTGPRVRSWHTVGSKLYCFGSDSVQAYGTRNRLWRMVEGSEDSALKPNQSGGFQAYASKIKWSFETSYFGGLDGALKQLKAVDFDFASVGAGFTASATAKGPLSARASLGESSCVLTSGAWRFQANEPTPSEDDTRGLVAGQDKHFGLTLSCSGQASLTLVTPHLTLVSESATSHPVDSEGSPVETPFSLTSHNPVTAS